MCVKEAEILSCKVCGSQECEHFVLKGGGLFDFSNVLQKCSFLYGLKPEKKEKKPALCAKPELN